MADSKGGGFLGKLIDVISKILEPAKGQGPPKVPRNDWAETIGKINTAEKDTVGKN